MQSLLGFRPEHRQARPEARGERRGRHARRPPVTKLVLLGAAALALSGCRVLAPSPSGFYRYVALGDSLSAGMQARGLTPDGQRTSFPVVLSELAESPIFAPEGLSPGCPPPAGIPPWLTSCIRANPLAITSNFAVPGARVRDLLHTSSQNASGYAPALYNLVLGPGETQVSAALRMKPLFITLWVGANDVLQPMLHGHPEQRTPPEEFEKHYEELLQALAPTGARIVLITVPNLSRVPAFIPGPHLSALGLAGAECARSPNLISHLVLAKKEYVKPVSCQESYALTPEEMQLVRETVRAYNGSIQRLGKQYGHPVFDADRLLRDFQPVSFDPDAREPFGPLFSSDGVHPSNEGQLRIAFELAGFMNERFGVRIVTNRANPQDLRGALSIPE